MSLYNDDPKLSFFKPGANLGDAALVYASLGLFVHPLRERSKQPVTKHGKDDSTTNSERIKKWWAANPKYNIAVALRYSSIAVIDVDPRNQGDQTLNDLVSRYGPLPPTFTVQTGGGGYHFYYRVDDDFYEQEYGKVLGPGLELLQNGYVVAPPSEVDGTGTYAIAQGNLTNPREDFAKIPFNWIEEAFAEQRLAKYSEFWRPESDDWFISQGDRDNTMAAIAGWARRMGANADEIAGILEVFLDRFENPDEMAEAIPRISRGMMKYMPGQVRFNDLRLTMRSRRTEPILDDKALWGPIGDWVRKIAPRSETHPAALLAQALVAFGNIIGAPKAGESAPGFTVGATRHTTGMFAMIIGESAKAGKGDAWAHVRQLMRYVDQTWEPTSGVQTGEGLIDVLADDQILDDATNINGTLVHHVLKGGNRDRRYFIYEPEFGRTLHTASRTGSTLKDVYRDLWDTGATTKVTAGSKQKVTGATVSLVGHITKPELERDFDAVDLMSGFGNRFLHIYSKRTKVLADERPLPRKTLERYALPLQEALEFARSEAPDDYLFTTDAWELWVGLCNELARQNPSPLLDALAARGRPIVRRLAIVYAVADCEDRIHTVHLEAAWALWQYIEQTIDYIFGSRLGNRDADWIMRLLGEHRAGLMKSDFYNENRNMTNARVTAALSLLHERGMIQTRKERRQRKTVEIYFIPPDWE